MTQRELGDLSGVHFSQIARWEDGERMPKQERSWSKLRTVVGVVSDDPDAVLALMEVEVPPWWTRPSMRELIATTESLKPHQRETLLRVYLSFEPDENKP